MTEEKLVTIKTYSYHNDCLIDKAKIESAGIPCMLVDENTIMVQPFYSNALGGIKLQVNESDAEEALKILSDSPPEDSIDYNSEENKYNEVIPDSGKERPRTSKLTLITIILFFLLVLVSIILRNFKF
jgi:hypothetical protein